MVRRVPLRKSWLRPEGNLPLQSLVEAQARHLPRGSTVVMITPSSSDVVYQTADILLRRGLRPVVVLIDSTSFGGFFSTQRLAASLQSLRVPCCEVKYEEDLSVTLSSTISTAQLM